MRSILPPALVALSAVTVSPLSAQCESGVPDAPGGMDAGAGSLTPGFLDRTRLRPRTGLGSPRPTTAGMQWERWWEFNKEPWLRLKESIYSGTPITGLPRNEPLPKGTKRLFSPNGMDRGKAAIALRHLLEKGKADREVEASALLALARARADMDVLRLLRKFVASKDAKKSEYAAVALGISGLEEALPDLLALASCSKRGHALCGRAHVPFRTRAYACYGIALLGNATEEPETRRLVATSMRSLLATRHRHDIKVAALHALRLLQPDATYKGEVLQHEILETLTAFAERKRGKKAEAPQVRAHAVTAIGEVAGRERSGTYVRRVRKILADRRESSWVHQSAVLALGKMVQPTDEQTCAFLRQYQTSGKDKQARFFAAIALGEIGGAQNRDHLYKRLRKRKVPAIHKPWLALGLAILDRTARDNGIARRIDRTVADAIHQEMRRTRNPSIAAGFATALGIMQYKDAGRDVLERLKKYRHRDESAGHMAVALSLMGFEEAIEDLEEIVDDSFNHPRLMGSCAIALALLGEKDAALQLLKHLRKRRSGSVHAALVQALGYIGDRRTVGPLIDMIKSAKLGSVAKAFTCSALGNVADGEVLRWDNPIATGINYETEIESLTGPTGAGVLDTN